MDTELYWHFVQVDDDDQPRLRDGRTVKVGETLKVEGTPVLCDHGFHASQRLWDGLNYAEGDRLSLCRVSLGGTVLHDDDKSVGTERTVVAMLSPAATEQLLRGWARWCALQVIHLWAAPDVVLQYLETGDESIRDEALDEARATAWNVAWDAAGVAAWAAAFVAARAAARDAARATAWNVAWDAARVAAWDATWDATRMAAWIATWDATWDAAGAAAWSPAIESYAEELERRALEAIAQPA